MTTTGWVLLGVAIAASIAFPVVLVAIAKSMGPRDREQEDGK